MTIDQELWFQREISRELQQKLWFEQMITDQKFYQVRYDILALQVQNMMREVLRERLNLQRQLGTGTLLPYYYLQPVSRH